MNLIKISLGNAVKNIWRSKLINFLCLGIIAFTLLITGIFNYITYSLETFTNNFSKNIEAIFYFKNDVDQKKINMLIEKLKESLLVESVVFNSRAQAEMTFSRQFPELSHILTEFNESPFPSSIEVKFKQEEYNINTKIISYIEDIEKLGIIESKQVNTDWAKKILSIKKFISVIGLFLSGILFFVSIFIIYNVIRLNIFYREEEIRIFRLVGATDWYIKFPFIIEGGLLGLSGSILASVFLFIILKMFPSYAQFMFDIFREMINIKKIPGAIFIKLIILGTAIGIFSSFFSLKRFFKSDAENK